MTQNELEIPNLRDDHRWMFGLVKALSLTLALLVVIGAIAATLGANPTATTITQRATLFVTASITAVLSLSLGLPTRLRSATTISRTARHIALIVMILVSIILIPATDAQVLLFVTVAAVFIAASWIGRGGTSGTVATVVGVSTVLWMVRSAETGLVFLVFGSGIAVVRGVLMRVLRDARESGRLLSQARSAASALSDVILRVEHTVHQARIYEVTRERRRVAREIHDSVGYTLTGLIVQLGVVSRLVTNADARDRLESLEKIARNALQEVRMEVGSLRADISDEQVASYRHRWMQVCEYFGECTGVRVDHQFANDLEAVTGEIGDTVYRIIQESLTNAYRHGEATMVDVSMSWKQDRELILLRISDNGRGLQELKPGNGLTGIRERVEALRGEVVFQTQPGRGFDLGVDIPWTGGHPAAEAG